VALGSNARLAKRVRRLLGRARQHQRTTGEAVALFGETRYAARRWSHRRRVVMKAEVVVHPGRPPKNNPRFVVTNLALTPAHVYQVYRERGTWRTGSRSSSSGLALDRTSCSRFQANAFRVLLTVAAYVLFQELRRRAARTACADAQVWTLRDRLLKVAAWVQRSVRRIVVHLPRAFPWRPAWQQVARTVGATA
jgi:hypothetical protein